MAGTATGGSAEVVRSGEVGARDGRSGGVRSAAPTAAARRAVGAYGERVAALALVEAGMQILDRNWRCREGELDIVALDGSTLVFCEVKTRRSGAYGAPVEAVTPVKAARLRRLAGAWLAEHPDPGVPHGGLRIDVVSVMRPRAGAAQVEHLRGVC